ncbi:MAG TPA: hypothetical protein VFZ55_01190 [Nitrososphaera sp.]
MEKERQQDIKKTRRKTYGKIALQDNNESGSSSSCCAPGCCSSDSPVQAISTVVRKTVKT